MRHALVSDVHGNLEALDAVLADLATREVHDVACLGDFVGYGASPDACIDRLRDRVAVSLLGNHDDAVLHPEALAGFNPVAAEAARWTRDALSAEHRAWLATLPLSCVWHGARLVHASPIAPEAWTYLQHADDAAGQFAGYPEALCFVGHTHAPVVFVRTSDGRTHELREPFVTLRDGARHLVVVPSVGQPRDHDPRAGYLIWDDAAGTLECVRVAYDVDGAAARIRGAGLPPRLADRLSHGV
jgi:diadenosine tetraphosphatase ApaH/serine/threonine PP2A family protein phosphatase